MWKQRIWLYGENLKTSWDEGLFYSQMYPPNVAVQWVDTDQPESATYQKDISYSFNEYGFRSDPFSTRSEINILTAGCSMTVGVGVDQSESWPFVLGKLLEQKTGKTVSVWNLATSGASPDYVVRSIAKTIGILDPTFVFVYWPPITRIETPNVLADKNLTQTFLTDKSFPKEYVNERWLEDYYFAKNRTMLQMLCKAHGIPCHDNPVLDTMVESIDGDFFPADSSGRDGQHPGPEWHCSTAQYFLQNLRIYC